MKKRVHVHQLRVGMYVEEIEGFHPKIGRRTDAFMISTKEEVDQIMHCNAISAVIDVTRGLDVVRSTNASDVTHFEAQLIQKYSPEAMKSAKATIAKAIPEVRSLFRSAHDRNTVDMASASSAVENIMTAAADNAGMLISLTKLKNKDEATFLHSLSVSALLITFGRSLGLAEDTIHLIGLGGLLHDIGKMKIPSVILRKRGKLTEREYAVVRSHPDRGYGILSLVEDISPIVLDICLRHHEKYDGSGYPGKIAGDAIPYAARLAAICDVYDAMTTIRPYKKPWSQAEAIDAMWKASGHFDPEIMRLFVSRMILTGQIT